MTNEGETATWQETISGDGGPRFVRGREELTLRYLTALEQQARRVPGLEPWKRDVREWGKSRLHVAIRTVLQDEASVGLASSYNLTDQVFSLMLARAALIDAEVNDD